MNDSILLERDQQIATVIFNRPRQRNAINFAMWERLWEIALELDDDPDVRVVIIRGAGDTAFSAGADIADFEVHRNNSVNAQKYAEVFEGALDAIAALGKPTISLIRGYCFGGGLELATFTDIRIASDDAKFSIPTARLAVVAGFKEVRQLVGLIGQSAAMNLLLTARAIDSHEAKRIGLITDLVPTAEIVARTYELANQLRDVAPLAARWHKQILQTVISNPSLQGLTAEEQALQFACFDSEDFLEGRRAFLEKRKPTFEGK